MNKKYAELAMVDIVEALLRESNKPLAIQDIFAKIAEIKEFSLEDVDRLTTLYMNITQSGKFVFVGDDKWDLKEGNLDLWSDDGSAFIEIVDDLEDEEEFTKYDPADYDDFEDDEEELDEDEMIDDDFEDEDEEEDDLDEETKKELEEEKEYIEVELPLHTSDDDDDIDFDADDFDEDDYEEIMDDYEDMYED
ncbi:MAG TPA: DNA-directed RNA polymerase subunit delta [Acholeplasma sp.]|nr:DNA-directed RNA polymerase subunit delta [Acholeplasma sp.]